MRSGGLHPMALALLVAGCGSQSPEPQRAAPDKPTVTSTEASGPQLDVLAFGDSLFAGYGLATPDLSYPAQLEKALRSEGRNVRISNAGVSGDTTAAGLQRLAFTLGSQPAAPDLVLLELGGNDLLRGLPPKQTRSNLDAMLTELDKRGVAVILMGLQAPPNYGDRYLREFNAIYTELATKHGATLIPFVTEQVFADPKLIQADHVHPTSEGVAVLVRATKDAVAQALPPATTPGG